VTRKLVIDAAAQFMAEEVMAQEVMAQEVPDDPAAIYLLLQLHRLQAAHLGSEFEG
jgi:hypothetical protein